MRKLLFLTTLVAVCLVGARRASPLQAAQENAGAQIRFVQIFYTAADVYIDETMVVGNVEFTVGTDYMPIAAGSHTLAVTAAGTTASSPAALEVEDGHRYTILTMGQFETGNPQLLTIDETSTFADTDPQGNNAIIVQNVPGAIPVDVWFVDELKIENLTFGTYGAASAPLGAFTAEAVMAGNPGVVMFESHYFAVPGTLSLAYLSGTFPDDINRTFFTTTDDNMADYLSKHVGLEGSSLSTLYELLEIAGLMDELAGDGQYTLFAPTNEAFAALTDVSVDDLKANPEALAAILSYHLVEGRFTPYELQGEHTLTSVQGSPLNVVFQPIDPLTVNGAITGLQHRTSNGIIYLVDEVLLPE